MQAVQRRVPRAAAAAARAAPQAERPPSFATPQANPLVFFDIQLGRYGDATPIGRIVSTPWSTGGSSRVQELVARQQQRGRHAG